MKRALWAGCSGGVVALLYVGLGASGWFGLMAGVIAGIIVLAIIDEWRETIK
jgi:hypothetical protein